MIPALWRQRQVDLSEFKVSLVSREFRTVKATQRNLVCGKGDVLCLSFNFSTEVIKKQFYSRDSS